jgi:hypothetical protein
MSRNDPYPAPEIADIFHMACNDALAAGDLPAALATARQVQHKDLVDEYPYVSAGIVIPALVLTGQVHEALRHAAAVWDGWQRLALWISPAVSVVALAFGLLGDDRAFRLWRARAAEVVEVARTYRYRYVASLLVFVDARLAVHTLRLTDASAVVDRAFAHPPSGWCDTYARAAAAGWPSSPRFPTPPNAWHPPPPQATRTAGLPPASPAPPAGSTATPAPLQPRSTPGPDRFAPRTGLHHAAATRACRTRPRRAGCAGPTVTAGAAALNGGCGPRSALGNSR